jgi:hypothetical protein
VNKNVLPAIVRLDEAEAFLRLEPLHSPSAHVDVLSSKMMHVCDAGRHGNQYIRSVRRSVNRGFKGNVHRREDVALQHSIAMHNPRIPPAPAKGTTGCGTFDASAPVGGSPIDSTKFGGNQEQNGGPPIYPGKLCRVSDMTKPLADFWSRDDQEAARKGVGSELRRRYGLPDDMPHQMLALVIQLSDDPSGSAREVGQLHSAVHRAFSEDMSGHAR